MSIHLDIKIDKSKFLEDYLREALRMALVNASMRIQGELAGMTPVDTGKLKSTFRAVVLPRGIRLQWGTNYAVYPDLGTDRHFIAPVEKKALHWPGGYSKGHWVKGQRAQHYREKTGVEAMKILKEEIFNALFTLKTMVS